MARLERFVAWIIWLSGICLTVIALYELWKHHTIFYAVMLGVGIFELVAGAFWVDKSGRRPIEPSL